MNLAKEISFLLFKHHCVILPSFGAFLINKKDAERSVESKFALPKKEIVSFNRQITQNDGLLANHISVSLGCTYNDGLAIAEQYVEDLWGQLHTKKNIEIAEVGTFYYTQDEKLIFVPYHSVNFAT